MKYYFSLTKRIKNKKENKSKDCTINTERSFKNMGIPKKCNKEQVDVLENGNV